MLTIEDIKIILISIIILFFKFLQILFNHTTSIKHLYYKKLICK